ncbi:hypothetical protein R1sor_011598 [Riccia sorocarpa]|uniref:WRC domain-containing protein n=1 Tax=Riccia sorocarpa TaxID=122646 RepID=A0ABD3I420_9MARC
MRIRKNRTSSRVTPEFCLAHGIVSFEKKQDFSQSTATESISSLGDHCTELEKPELDASPLHEDFNKTDHSLDDDKRASVSIQSTIGGMGRLGECKKHRFSSETPQSNESDTDAACTIDPKHLDDRTTAKLHIRVKPPSSSLHDKVKSNPSSKPTGKGSQRSDLQKEVAEESEITHSSLLKPTIISVTGTGYGSRKRRRSRTIEPRSAVAYGGKKGTGKPRFEGEGYGHDYKPAAAAPAAGMAMEVSRRKKERKFAIEEEENEGYRSRVEFAEGSSFPAGWSYRGLAQIAEKDKAPQGKQCSRTDGRSWRCPLKVQEGFTLCEHHLSKFRLKKVSKENRRQKSLHWRRQRRQQQEQILQSKGDEEEHQLEQETRNSSAPDESSRTAESVQTSASSERNVPMRFRRKHKTVKLSVL